MAVNKIDGASIVDREVEAAMEEARASKLRAKVEPYTGARPSDPEAGGGTRDRNKPRGAPQEGGWVSGGPGR